MSEKQTLTLSFNASGIPEDNGEKQMMALIASVMANPDHYQLAIHSNTNVDSDTLKQEIEKIVSEKIADNDSLKNEITQAINDKISHLNNPYAMKNDFTAFKDSTTKQVASIVAQMSTMSKSITDLMADHHTTTQLMNNIHNRIAILAATQQDISNRVTSAPSQENKTLQKEVLNIQADIDVLKKQYEILSKTHVDPSQEIKDLSNKFREFEVDVANNMPPTLNGNPIKVNIDKQ